MYRGEIIMHHLAVTFVSLFITTSDGFVENQLFDREGPVVITDETRLHNDLFFTSRESHPTNEALDVKFGLTLISVVDYDAAGEGIVINAFIRQKWKNPMISWDPDDYGGIKNINVRPEKTWVPDIYAYGDVEAQFKYNGLLDTLKTNIIVSSDGNHSWLAPIIMNLGCGMNVKDFPFDTQTCPLLFGSFTYDKSRLNLIPIDVNMDKYSESSEWIFKSMNHTREEILYPGSTVEFSDVKYTVILKRKTLYFFMNLLLPTMSLAFLTLLVFIQPVKAGERSVFIITILLALCWFVTSALDYLPSSSEGTPLSQVFICMSLLVIILLSICLCYSIAFHYGDLGANEMPIFLRKYVLGRLGPYLGCHLKREYPLWRKNLNIIREAETHLYAADKVSIDVVSNDDKLEHYFPQPQTTNTSFGGSEDGDRDSLEKLLGISDVDQLNFRLDIILNKLEEDDANDWIKREWKTLAIILDHLFLYFFSSVLGIMVVYCAVYILYIP